MFGFLFLHEQRIYDLPGGLLRCSVAVIDSAVNAVFSSFRLTGLRSTTYQTTTLPNTTRLECDIPSTS